MQMHFKTREQARKAGFGKLVDNGATAQHGKRFGRNVEAMATNNNVHNMECPLTARQIPVFVRGKNKL